MRMKGETRIFNSISTIANSAHKLYYRLSGRLIIKAKRSWAVVLCCARRRASKRTHKKSFRCGSWSPHERQLGVDQFNMLLMTRTEPCRAAINLSGCHIKTIKCPVQRGDALLPRMGPNAEVRRINVTGSIHCAAAVWLNGQSDEKSGLTRTRLLTAACTAATGTVRSGMAFPSTSPSSCMMTRWEICWATGSRILSMVLVWNTGIVDDFYHSLRMKERRRKRLVAPALTILSPSPLLRHRHRPELSVQLPGSEPHAFLVCPTSSDQHPAAGWTRTAGVLRRERP